MTEEHKSFTEVISEGDTRNSLLALRDYVAHELQGNRCKACQMSQLRTGDTAALVLRLQKIIEDIEKLRPPANSEGEAGVTDLASIRNRRAADGRSVPANPDNARLGTQNAPRRQGGRQPRFRGDRSS